MAHDDAQAEGLIRGSSKRRHAHEKTEVENSEFYVSIGGTNRTTNRRSSAIEQVEDQTDRLENQKVREVSKNDQVFNLPDVEVERKVQSEILQARFSNQTSVEEERTDRSIEQNDRDEELTDVLQNQTSRFSILADRLLEQNDRDSILQGMEEERKDLF